jgi:hypothetical protein
VLAAAGVPAAAGGGVVEPEVLGGGGGGVVALVGALGACAEGAVVALFASASSPQADSKAQPLKQKEIAIVFSPISSSLRCKTRSETR